MNRRFVVATALLVPALVFVSCKDDGNSNPVEPAAPNAVLGVTHGAKPTRTRIRTATAPKAVLLRAGGVTAQLTGPAAHDPQPFGSVVTCLSGPDFSVDEPGTSLKFDNNRGCEVNTYLNDNGDGVAGLRPNNTSYRGKKLTDINHVDAYFAGGSPNQDFYDFPYWQIPIDECAPPSGQVATANVQGCGPGKVTDGIVDDYAYISFYDCNDSETGQSGDQFTGASKAQDDATCDIYYDGNGTSYDNWQDFENDLDGARIARQVFNADLVLTGAYIYILSGDTEVDDYFNSSWHGLIHRVLVN